MARKTVENTHQTDQQPKGSRIGRLLTDMRERTAEKANAELRAMRDAKLEAAVSIAVGPNKDALEVCRVATAIADATNRGRFQESGEKRDMGGNIKITKRHWNASFSTDEPTSQFADPVESLPFLLAQGEEIPVNSVVVTTDHDLETDGVHSTIFVNDTVGLAANARPTGEEKPPKFGDALRIDIASDGTTTFNRESDRISGYTDVTYTEANVTSFLQGVAAAGRTSLDMMQQAQGTVG